MNKEHAPEVESPQGNASPASDEPKRTPEEIEFLRHMTRVQGRPLTRQEENNMIAQAELMGEL